MYVTLSIFVTGMVLKTQICANSSEFITVKNNDLQTFTIHPSILNFVLDMTNS